MTTPQALDLSLLDEDQRQAVLAPRGPVCILAGAGTGKTRTITYRMAYLAQQGMINPTNVLAVSFTTRAAGEMSDRLKRLGVGGIQARTFHSAAMRQLQYFWPQVVGDLPWKILPPRERYQLIGRVTRMATIEPSKDNVRDVSAEIDWAKATLITPEGYPEAVQRFSRKPPAKPELVAKAYAKYEELKASPEGMALDFSDLLAHVAGAIETSPGVAEQFRQQYRTFVVDEYQDVTPLQQRVLEAWLGPRQDLTVVGDANQTIYSFAGATPDNLLNFSRTYKDAVVVKLQRDYRSTPQITDLANEVISKATGRMAGTRLELEGMRPNGPRPKFKAYESEPQEAAEVAAQILKLIRRGVPESEIAVLYRINSQSLALEEALADAGISYQVRGGEGFFDRAEIRLAIGELVKASRRTDLPDDPVQVTRAALAGIGYSSQEPEGAQARERWQLLDALVGLVEQQVATMPGITLTGVIEDLQQRRANKQPPTVNGVTLATIHAAKGLEWDAVFLVGVTENLLPFRHAIKAGGEQLEEERRLFYVGITRAREHLQISWPLAKNPDSPANRKRSRFLDGIVPSLQASSGKSRTSRAKACRVCRQPLSLAAEKALGRHEDCDGGMEEGLFRALRSWRAQRAKEMGCPAYIVFSDITLTNIAESKPRDNADLLSIPGVGPMKINNFGAEILQIVSSHGA
ncbi:ATP-dependent DNA helicase [Corynebacterium phocae]|uniref:DNA 3'-5' helicase n=1 Tax=Corynebacterium phocae TaxID=161895 RepID=A0A1L7D4K7_9CORY|nr:ATP-dependent DNA helicase UvrD2 [Corynebacterium phocae]APT93068.1 ATP-dependent DNA helicase [Corynebacterium phocae]KAA8722369.1 ATP-dependent DNA helicase UvrD2 [Corynebacterium phocae]